jgi:16S rRNA (guanine527-N7)-methyltransferase
MPRDGDGSPTDPGGKAISAVETPLSLSIAASALGSVLSGEQLRQLDAYAHLLERWGRVYNLTAVLDAPRIGTVHLLDSLAIVPLISRHGDARSAGPAHRVLDVGSGGGLPGVVIAIARPDWRVRCVDAVAKKVGFVRQVAVELGLKNIVAEHRRVGERRGQGAADVVVSRAFASLSNFCTWTRDELAPDGVWLAMKGRVPHDEIAQLPPAVEVFHVEPLSVPGLDAERCAVWLRPRPDERIGEPPPV